MLIKFSYYLKLVLVCCLLNFCLCSIYAQNKDDSIELMLNQIPKKYGVLREVSYSCKGAPWVIYITDYHCQYEAQKNINNILYYINSRLGNGMSYPVCVEGASGYVDTSLLASIPSEDIANSVSGYLLKKGKISGSEFYSAVSNPYAKLVGVDDVNLYNESYSLYSNVIGSFNKIGDDVKRIDSVLDKIKSAKFSLDSIEIIKSWETFNERLSAEGFLVGTEKYWGKIPSSNLPINLVGYVKLLKRKNTFSSNDIIALEKKLLAKAIGIQLNGEAKVISEINVNFQLGNIDDKEYLRALLDFSKKNNILTNEFNTLSEYLDVIEKISAIKPDDINKLCTQTYASLKNTYLTKDELAYLKTIEVWHSLKKLHSLEATRDCYIELSKEDIGGMFSSINKFIDETKATENRLTFDFMRDFIDINKNASEFYANSIKRDSYLVSNTITTINKEKSGAAFIVAGGFHFKGIIDGVKKAKLNYAVIQPSFNQGVSVNYYRGIMLNEPLSIDKYFLLALKNRLAPRIKLANVLADPSLTQQLIKEAVLLAKLSYLAESNELFELLRGQPFLSPIDFTNQAVNALVEFGDKWVAKVKEIQAKKGVDLDNKWLSNFRSYLFKYVFLEKAVLEKGNVSLGVKVFNAENKLVKMRVFMPYQRLIEKQMRENLPAGVEPPALSTIENVGQFSFYFSPDVEEVTQPLFRSSKPKTLTQRAGGESIKDVVSDIAVLKKQLSDNPFDVKTKMLLSRKLQALSRFLMFASREEEKAGKIKESLILKANARLYAGDVDMAESTFESYLKLLSPDEIDYSPMFFLKGVFIRGQKIALPIEDSQKRPYLDQNGAEILSPMFDDTLIYGSEPSTVVQNRLIELSKVLDGKNKKYLAEVVATMAARLTDPSRNYHLNTVDLAFFIQSGKNAYLKSHLGQSSSSYGAVSGYRATQAEVERMVPAVTYIYNHDITGEMIKNGDIQLVTGNDTAQSYKTIPPEALSAILVNKAHLKGALEVIASHPMRNMPVLDTDGNLLWRNAPLGDLIKKYGEVYNPTAKDNKDNMELTYFKKVAKPSKIIGFGDLHSDYVSFRKTLVATGIWDDKENFIAPAGTAIIINGDFTDMGTGKAMKEMIDTIMKLQKQAVDKQAVVIATMGNHEAMFLSGNFYDKYSEKTMVSFLKEIGFSDTQIDRIKEALKGNDQYSLATIRNENPEAMRYIDFLWQLPLVAQVGGHVFVHGGPTEYFNNAVSELLKSHPDLSTEAAIEVIVKNEIRENGFNSKFFSIGYDSIVTGAPEFGVPKFIENPDIVDTFLSYFPGANIVAVGHNKALGVLGKNALYDKIVRVGVGKNVVKMDVGTRFEQAVVSAKVVGKAYVVDPKEQMFVYSVDEAGDKVSLVRKGDTRFALLNTDLALMHDAILQNNVVDIQETGNQQHNNNKVVPEIYLKFFRIVFLVYASAPDTLNSSFIQQVDSILKGNKIRPFQTDETAVNELYTVFLDYLKKVSTGQINRKDVSLLHFQQYVADNSKVNIPNISAKQLGKTVIDFESDIPLFYSTMYNSDIQSVDNNIINAVRERLEKTIKEYQAKGTVDRTRDELTRISYYLKQAGTQLFFYTLEPPDGNPGILMSGQGEGLAGFIIDNKIYLSKKVVSNLWESYENTKDPRYLDDLLALFAHELHEYRENQKMTKDNRIRLHKESEELEILLCGKGQKGSMLDDYIYRLIQEWQNKTNTENTDAAIKKFLGYFRNYLRESKDIEGYGSIFTAMGVPFESDLQDNANAADQMFELLMTIRNRDMVYSIMSLFPNSTAMLEFVDTSLFTDKELLSLVQVFSEISSLLDKAIMKPDLKAIVESAPAPKPEDINKDMKASSEVGRSI